MDSDGNTVVEHLTNLKSEGSNPATGTEKGSCHREREREKLRNIDHVVIIEILVNT